MSSYFTARKECNVPKSGNLYLGKDIVDNFRNMGVNRLSLYPFETERENDILNSILFYPYPGLKHSKYNPKIQASRTIYIGKGLRTRAGFVKDGKGVLTVFHTWGNLCTEKEYKEALEDYKAGKIDSKLRRLIKDMA